MAKQLDVFVLVLIMMGFLFVNSENYLVETDDNEIKHIGLIVIYVIFNNVIYLLLIRKGKPWWRNCQKC